MRSLAVLLLLWCGGQDSDVDKLIKQLEDDSAIAREEAVKALVEAGDKAVPALKCRMRSAEKSVRKLCVEILEKIAVPKHLRGVLPPISRVTIDAKDRSLREVLEEVQNQARLPMQLGLAGRAAQWPKVTVKIEDAAPLEALTAVCRAAKQYWFYPSEGAWGGMRFEDPNENKASPFEGRPVSFSPGDYDKPRLFNRHYMLEVWELVFYKTIDFRTEKTRGELSLNLFWPPAVNPHSVRFEVPSAVDDQGKELIEGHDDPSYPTGPRHESFWSGNPQAFSHRWRLKYPTEGARSIASFKGRVRLNYLLRARTVSFMAPEKEIGARKEIEGASAELLEFTSQDSYITAKIRIQGSASGDPPRVRALMENDKFSLPFVGHRSKDDPPSVYSVYLEPRGAKVASLEVVVDAVTAEDSFDFEFKDIHLP